MKLHIRAAIIGLVAVVMVAASCLKTVAAAWELGAPIVSYWQCDESITSAAKASQLAAGGWNWVCCTESELDSLQSRGLRGLLHAPILSKYSASKEWNKLLDGSRPADLAELNALIARVHNHPALYAYKVSDEPAQNHFQALSNMVAYLRSRDPAHLAYVNLYPVQVGRPDGTGQPPLGITYEEYLRLYIAVVKPSLISYDKYPFYVDSDAQDFFENLAIIRNYSLNAGLPFMQIVQACRFRDNPAQPYPTREPSPNQIRFQLYTTLAYGGQGISYFMYTCPDCGCQPVPYDCTGGISGADGTPTVLYSALSTLNREFVAIASRLRPLRSLGAYHSGFIPQGATALPGDSAFQFDPPIPASGNPLQGALLGCFGPPGAVGASAASQALVVNLDYNAEVTVGVRGPGWLRVLDPSSGQWTTSNATRIELRLPPGGGVLVGSQPIYVDGGHSGCEDGTPACPFRTVQAAYNASVSEDELSIAAGSYPEVLRMTKSLRLTSRNGTARIGR